MDTSADERSVLVQEFMSFLKHADLCTHDFALELVGQEGGFHGKLAYSQQMFADSIGQRFTSSFEVHLISLDMDLFLVLRPTLLARRSKQGSPCVQIETHWNHYDLGKEPSACEWLSCLYA